MAGKRSSGTFPTPGSSTYSSSRECSVDVTFEEELVPPFVQHTSRACVHAEKTHTISIHVSRSRARERRTQSKKVCLSQLQVALWGSGNILSHIQERKDTLVRSHTYTRGTHTEQTHTH